MNSPGKIGWDRQTSTSAAGKRLTSCEPHLPKPLLSPWLYVVGTVGTTAFILLAPGNQRLGQICKDKNALSHVSPISHHLLIDYTSCVSKHTVYQPMIISYSMSCFSQYKHSSNQKIHISCTKHGFSHFFTTWNKFCYVCHCWLALRDRCHHVPSSTTIVLTSDLWTWRIRCLEPGPDCTLNICVFCSIPPP